MKYNNNMTILWLWRTLKKIIIKITNRWWAFYVEKNNICQINKNTKFKYLFVYLLSNQEEVGLDNHDSKNQMHQKKITTLYFLNI